MPIKFVKQLGGSSNESSDGSISLAQRFISQYCASSHHRVARRFLFCLDDFIVCSGRVSQSSGKVANICADKAVVRIVLQLSQRQIHSLTVCDSSLAHAI